MDYLTRLSMAKIRTLRQITDTDNSRVCKSTSRSVRSDKITYRKKIEIITIIHIYRSDRISYRDHVTTIGSVQSCLLEEP